MTVQIRRSTGEIIWERDESGGLACRAYVEDGTQARIIGALRGALEQAEFEFSASSDVADRVLDVGSTSS